MENKPSHTFRAFLIELLVYGSRVLVYVFFVVALLDRWLQALYDHSKPRYAVVALVLIIGQGVVLEMVTSFLLRLVRPRT